MTTYKRLYGPDPEASTVLATIRFTMLMMSPAILLATAFIVICFALEIALAPCVDPFGRETYDNIPCN